MNVLSCTTTISQLSWSENNINRNSLQQPWILICISLHILIHVSTRHLHRKKDQDWGWIDLGNEHDNGPHQDQIFDNLAVHCLALRSKNLIQLLEGLMHLTGSSWREYTSLIFLNFRSSRSKYSVSTISCFLVCFVYSSFYKRLGTHCDKQKASHTWSPQNNNKKLSQSHAQAHEHNITTTIWLRWLETYKASPVWSGQQWMP